jgi:hypothetical protein
MECTWKPDWEETKQHMIAWWRGEGLVLGMAGTPRTGKPLAITHDPGPSPSVAARYTDVRGRALRNHHQLARQCFPADAFPIAGTDIGPGSLALVLGSEPGFSPETVWFKPCIRDDPHPERRPPLTFDPENRWWQIHDATLKACVELAGDMYTVGCPDLVENIDVLASLRDSQTLLLDMIQRPDWVLEKVSEINQAWFEVYDCIYETIRLPDGGAVYGAFRLWGPGKTAKVQCDACAMFSSAMFERFVLPALTEQCEWLDYAMYHLDGEHCMHQLDALLSINALDAIEWTPSPRVPTGGDPAWYDLYRRILDADKSVQAVGVAPEEVLPLLDAVGGKGMYILTSCESTAQAEALAVQVEPYR